MESVKQDRRTFKWIGCDRKEDRLSGKNDAMCEKGSLCVLFMFVLSPTVSPFPGNF